MLKRSLLATTAILACTLFASQAQAVTQTIQWDFNTTFAPVVNKTLSSTSLLPLMTTTDDDIIANGWHNLPLNNLSLLSPHAVAGDLTGLGVRTSSSTETIAEFTTINEVLIGGTTLRTEVLALNLLNPLTFITSNGLDTALNATWEISLSGVDPSESVVVLTGATNNQPTLSLNTLSTNGFSIISSNLSQYLFIRQDKTITSTFQVSGLRFSYDDGCPVGGCVAPEPGMLGLLGFSLFGLAALRKRK